MHESEFEVEIVYEKQDLTVSGTCEWDIDNDSFDYAGTHCTHGQSGTEHLPDYLRAESCEIGSVEDENGNDFPISDPKVLSDIQSSILVALQEQEDDDGAEMKNIIEIAEDAAVQAQIDNLEERNNYYG